MIIMAFGALVLNDLVSGPSGQVYKYMEPLVPRGPH